MPRLKSIESKVAKLSVTSVARTATHSIGGRPWRRIRERVLKRDSYLCQLCLPDRVTPARDVDHIVPRHLGGGDNEENLQSLCRECHEAKSRAEGGARGWGGVESSRL